MAEHKLQKSWSHLDNQQRLSLEDFLALIREYLATITTARENLKSAYSFLKKQEKIQQDQFNYLIGLAHSMDNPVRELSHILDQKACLPVAILPLRYQLTTKLLNIKELLWIVLALVGSLRSMRKSDLQESAMARYKMLQKLDALLQESDNVAQFTQIFSDQAHFQGSRNKSTLSAIFASSDDCHKRNDNQNIYDISLYRR